MTELEAVNMMLRAIGSNPVNSISTDQPDVSNARATLSRVSNRVQKRGWWYNTDYAVTYQANVDGEVSIPKEIVKFVPCISDYVNRGGKVYDKINQTYLINTSVETIRVVRRFEWVVLPESMQDYIAYTAAVDFIDDEIEDSTKAQRFEVKAGMAKLELDAEDLESTQVNVFNNSRIRYARGGVQPYNRANIGLRPNG
jgi:hypothetical protein